MAATGGAPILVSIAGREFFPPADSPSTVAIGGQKSEVKPNANGSIRIIQTREAWSFTCDIQIDSAKKDQEFLQDIVDAGQEVDVLIEFPHNVVYKGQGLPSDDMLSTDTAEAKMSITLKGSGTLKQ